MRKTEQGEKNSKKYIIVTVIAVLLIAAILVVAFLDSKYGFFPEQNVDNGEVEYEGKIYVPRHDVETFLLMGLDKTSKEVDKNSYNNDSQADFLMLLVFDKANKTYSAIQINRDTVTKMDVLGVGGKIVGETNKQIALSHTYGNGGKESCKNVVRAVSNLLYGIDINYYMSLTLDSVGVVNDLVGGVELEVLDDFSALEENLGLVKGETVRLNAKQAQAYVQARRGVGDSTNDNRMKRQHQYLDALQKQVEEKMTNDSEFAMNALMQLSAFAVTDSSSARLESLSEKMKDFEFKGIKKLEGESDIVDNLVEFYPDDDFLTKMVLDFFYKVKEK